MKKNFLFLPFSLPVFLVLLCFPFLVLAILSLLELSPGPALQQTLGLSVLQTVALYLTLLISGIFNVPIYEFKSSRDSEKRFASYLGNKYTLPVWHGHNTVVAINFGAAVAVLTSVFLAISGNPAIVLLSTAVVALGVFICSRPSRSIGFYVPPFVPPLLSVAIALLALYIYSGPQSLVDVARVAFVASVFGTILGTSVLNLRRLQTLGTAFISIGGIGAFDGIVLSATFATIVGCVIVSI